MRWFILNPIYPLMEFVLYLVVDNITKFIVIHHRKDNRFNILVFECMFLGFLIGFASWYSYVPYVLIFFLLVHIIGTLYSEKGGRAIKRLFEICIELFQTVISSLYNCILNFTFRRYSWKRLSETKPIPKEYLYNYHLKPTNDLRLQQSSFIQTLPRPGILNLYGTTCSLNALLQSLASLNGFYLTLQRNINLSRQNYDIVVSTFLELLSQLRNDHQTADYKHWNTLLDTSALVSKLNAIYPNLLTPTTTTDLCEVFQCLIDVLDNSLSKQSSVYSTNVVEQVQNSKLATHSLEYLNKLFAETEIQLQDQITLDNLDSQASYIIQYVDLTWLLHHIQSGSLIKQTFSGQLLHAHCCHNCSHVRFRTEPFQIFPLSIPKTATTLERILSQLTKIEVLNSTACSRCSSDQNIVTKPSALLNNITTTLSPIVTSRRQHTDQIYSSTPISSAGNVLPSNRTRVQHRIKSQTMFANFPEILSLQLKRFSYDRLSNTAMKLNTSIVIEPEKPLDLSHLHYTTWLGLANSSISYHYRLIAVCLHLTDKIPSTSSSSTIGGHCVCLYRTDHNRWFLSDDERITEINQIDNLFRTPYVTDNCYLLFYERCP